MKTKLFNVQALHPYFKNGIGKADDKRNERYWFDLFATPVSLKKAKNMIASQRQGNYKNCWADFRLKIIH